MRGANGDLGFADFMGITKEDLWSREIHFRDGFR
jgi:hypothetical protein